MPRLTTSSAALFLAIALAGCTLPPPNFYSAEELRQRHPGATGSSEQVDRLMARRAAVQAAAEERLFRVRVLRALEEDD